MNTPNDPTAEGAAPQETTTHSNQWALKAAAPEPVDDVHTPTVDPLFGDGQVVRAVILAPEPVEDPDEKTESVRLQFKFLEEATTTDGTKKAPGTHTLRPFPALIQSTNPAHRNKLEMGRKSVYLTGVAAGVTGKVQSVGYKDVVTILSKLEGKEVDLKLTTRSGKNRDAAGNFEQFQNWVAAAPGTLSREAGNGGGATPAY